MNFGREITGHPSAALRREWLVTNGSGGYAMASLLANAPTRKYHGYLIAALEPPLGRTMLVGGLAVFAHYADHDYELSGFEWSDGTFSAGYRQLEHWSLEDTIPLARYACADAVLEQRIWMEHEANTTYVQWSYVRGNGPLDLRMQPLITSRDHHATTMEGDWQPDISPVPHGANVAIDERTTLRLLSDNATWTTRGDEWIERIHLRLETYRGYPDETRLLLAGQFDSTLNVGEQLTLIFSTASAPDLDGRLALERERARAAALLRAADLPAATPVWVRGLVLAADQFIVRRDVTLPDGSVEAGYSIIAGYPWFSDWGRDTMIALPGLLIATGRVQQATQVLRTWSRFVSQGMLPNRFPDAGAEPEYNTVDATLWFFQAIRAVYQHTGDRDLIAELYPILTDIVAWHKRGTRYSIKVADDGLLTAGEPEVQLTWMDAKYGDWVVTPRQGKAVEINALWYSALRTLAEFARDLKHTDAAEQFDAQANRVQQAFDRFWNGSYLDDVLDGPNGDDATLRPNQLFAIALAHSPLNGDRARQVVDVCARTLLTSYGLRSLAPDDPQYIGVYGGDLRSRDAAYHQGTTWGWLIGPFVQSYRRVFDATAARALLHPFADHVRDAGIGSISECFDGAAPFAPRACPWQAWSVAAVVWCWRENTTKHHP